MLSTTLTAVSLLSSTVAAETILGAYMFHRHGDRTAKLTPPANLTDLGQEEVFTSGTWFRNRYAASNATNPIYGLNSDIVKQSQIAVSAPSDTVLQNSATGFMQGFYPPVGDVLGSQILANGTNVTAPLNGYQLIPIAIVTSGTGSESSGWLEAATGCGAATTSSDEYFSSTQYMDLLNSTQALYTSLTPIINDTVADDYISFKNAYTIYDLINVAEIHNASIYEYSDILTADTLLHLRTLADTHEWNLGYNASNDIRAIAGMTLAAEIVQGLNTTITGGGKSKLNIQFGAYGSFGSFFGLAGLENVSEDFIGIADYASVMSFELVTNSTVSSAAPIPDTDDISVRFLFHNGTTSDLSPPTEYPLFGAASTLMSWSDFVTNMNNISVGTTEDWCNVCQNTTGVCAAYADSTTSSNTTTTGDSSNSSSGNGLSPAVNGVIGAMVTLAVILGLEALIMLVGGFRVVSKNRLNGIATLNGHNVQPKV